MRGGKSGLSILNACRPYLESNPADYLNNSVVFVGGGFSRGGARGSSFGGRGGGRGRGGY